MMKKIVSFTIILVCTLALLQNVQAKERTFGIGGIIDDPNGISLKAWLSESTAVAGAVSVDLGDNYSWVSVHADFLKQNTVVTWEEALLQTHFGGGVRIVSGEFQDFIALRAPIGIDVNAVDAPMEVFMEVVPTIDIDPEVFFYFSGAMGFRYYFGND
jgi:hypothetical protein